jgi:hypothetical protein
VKLRSFKKGDLIIDTNKQSIYIIDTLYIHSILRNDMPNREHVDAPEKQPRLTYSVVGWMGPQYLAWKDHSGFAAGPSLTRQGYQSWFCQFLGVAPPALAHYANQPCPCHSIFFKLHPPPRFSMKNERVEWSWIGDCSRFFF